MLIGASIATVWSYHKAYTLVLPPLHKTPNISAGAQLEINGPCMNLISKTDTSTQFFELDIETFNDQFVNCETVDTEICSLGAPISFQAHHSYVDFQQSS